MTGNKGKYGKLKFKQDSGYDYDEVESKIDKQRERGKTNEKNTSKKLGDKSPNNKGRKGNESNRNKK